MNIYFLKNFWQWIKNFINLPVLSTLSFSDFIKKNHENPWKKIIIYDDYLLAYDEIYNNNQPLKVYINKTIFDLKSINENTEIIFNSNIDTTINLIFLIVLLLYLDKIVNIIKLLLFFILILYFWNGVVKPYYNSKKSLPM